MKILIINHEFYPLGGGGANASAYLAKYMAQLGQNVFVVSSSYRTLRRNEEKDGYRIYRLPTLRRRIDRSTPLEMFSFIVSVLLYSPYLIKKISPHICIAFFGFPAGAITLAFKKCYKVPYIVSLRGHDVPGFLPERYNFYHKLLKPFTKLIWRQANAVVADGEGFRKLAQKTADSISIKVGTIPNAVDYEYFKPSIHSSENSYIKFLFLGRITKQKGLEYLLRAMSKVVAHNNNNVKLDIVGDGDLRGALEDLVKTLNLKDFITFHGWLNKQEVIKKYQSADIFILPSLYEGMSNAVLEAMSCGLPVIATDIPGNRELVIHGQNGLLVKPCNSSFLASSIIHLVKNEPLRKKMGERSRELCMRLSWEDIAKKYLQVINEKNFNFIIKGTKLK